MLQTSTSSPCWARAGSCRRVSWQGSCPASTSPWSRSISTLSPAPSTPSTPATPNPSSSPSSPHRSTLSLPPLSCPSWRLAVSSPCAWELSLLGGVKSLVTGQASFSFLWGVKSLLTGGASFSFLWGVRSLVTGGASFSFLWGVRSLVTGGTNVFISVRSEVSLLLEGWTLHSLGAGNISLLGARSELIITGKGRSGLFITGRGRSGLFITSVLWNLCEVWALLLVGVNSSCLGRVNSLLPGGVKLFIAQHLGVL